MDKEQAIFSAEKKRTGKILMVLIPATVVMIILAVIAGVYANMLDNERKVETSDGFIITATSDSFISAAKKSGYEEIYNEKENMPKIVKSAIIAVKDDDLIRFLEFKKTDDAKSFFALKAREFKEEAKKAGVTDAKERREENYTYYTASVESKYMHVVRVKNTVIFATAIEKNKANVENIIKELKY